MGDILDASVANFSALNRKTQVTLADAAFREVESPLDAAKGPSIDGIRKRVAETDPILAKQAFDHILSGLLLEAFNINAKPTL
ncbi:MAG: hypothetical protein KDD56_03195 [Bdellovibrionales bacterium]|nr:hypothetical protein [Bdellovibrionales bacterium]